MGGTIRRIRRITYEREKDHNIRPARLVDEIIHQHVDAKSVIVHFCNDGVTPLSKTGNIATDSKSRRSLVSLHATLHKFCQLSQQLHQTPPEERNPLLSRSLSLSLSPHLPVCVCSSSQCVMSPPSLSTPPPVCLCSTDITYCTGSTHPIWSRDPTART
jgi:hypothetical protein